MNVKLPGTVEQAILDALNHVGYSQHLIERNVEFDIMGKASSDYLQPAPLVAFWNSPFDQLTSAIGVRWLEFGDSVQKYVDAMAKHLWLPFVIIARPSECQIWEALPQNGAKGPALLEASVPYTELRPKVEALKHALEPSSVCQRKLRWRQLSLYEIARTPNAFYDWAFRPTQDQLKRFLSHLLQNLLHDHLDPATKAKRLRWLLRFVGVRIAWDKQWLPVGSRTDEKELVTAASQYPTSLTPTPETYEIAGEFIDITASLNLSIADSGLLSQVLQTHGLISDLRKEWKLYPTPQDIAWKMLQAVPIEAIPPGDRVIWDGTCGTGTLLVVSMERLKQLEPKVYEDQSQISNILIGNDQQPLLGDITRMALDTALGKMQSPSWNIQTGNVLNFTKDSFAKRPNIIVGNPPFKGKGVEADLAVSVINKYIEVLEPGGLLAVVLPRTILGVLNKHAVQFRKNVIENFELFELWELPQGFAPGVGSEAAIVCGRKRYTHESQRSAVVWRLFDPSRHIPPLTRVVASPDVWIKTPNKALESPLMLRLREHFKDSLLLSSVISEARIFRGIDPGKAGRINILEEEEDGSQPYLTGRTSMVPFYLHWRQDPRWIRYESASLERSKKQYEPLFHKRKVLVTRRATGGSPWSVQAAVDDHFLYPSADYIIISPEPEMSCDLVAGLFNSILINIWIRLANPSRTIRSKECARIPIPDFRDDQMKEKIISIAKELTTLRYELAVNQILSKEKHNKLEELTLNLDEVVYDAYNVPEDLRAEVAAYIIRFNKARPGFNRVIVKEYRLKVPKAEEVFTTEDSHEMKQLLERRKQRELTEEESETLDALVARWERAQLLSSTAALIKDNPEWAGSIA